MKVILSPNHAAYEAVGAEWRRQGSLLRAQLIKLLFDKTVQVEEAPVKINVKVCVLVLQRRNLLA